MLQNPQTSKPKPAKFCPELVKQVATWTPHCDLNMRIHVRGSMKGKACLYALIKYYFYEGKENNSQK